MAGMTLHSCHIMGLGRVDEVPCMSGKLCQEGCMAGIGVEGLVRVCKQGGDLHQ